jgi:hypothetical protein
MFLRKVVWVSESDGGKELFIDAEAISESGGLTREG